MDAIPLKQMILPLIVLDDTPYLGKDPQPRLLDDGPAKGALIVATWPKVRNGLGFPARAFAISP